MVAAPDATAQLVQLREAEFIGAVHDDGVGVRVVDACFNNRRAQQHIGALVVKITHDVFEFALMHLPVREGDAGFGHEFFELLAAVVNR